jgi:hypothetical protein
MNTMSDTKVVCVSNAYGWGQGPDLRTAARNARKHSASFCDPAKIGLTALTFPADAEVEVTMLGDVQSDKAPVRHQELAPAAKRWVDVPV